VIDILGNLLLGISTAFSVNNILYCTLGCIIGTIIGVLPGIGPVATISMILPVTYGLGPTTSIIMLAGIYYGAQYGGSTTAILLNTPGEASSVMTCIDGNQMTKNGEAGKAIIAAGVASFIAGCIATIFIAAFSIPLSNFALKFGPTEYCSLMLLGFISISILTSGDMINGIGMAVLGILFGIVGTDINSGVNRFTYGWPDLVDGIGFANIAVGVFGIAEIIRVLTSKEKSTLYQDNIKLIPTWKDICSIIPASLRGTVVGSFSGILPGGGAAISSFAAYAIEKKVSPNRDMFSQGAIEGVAAPEAANNAAAQTGFIPLLSLGIPENAVMSLMLAALMLNGIQPGPDIIVRQPELFWGLIVSMLIGNTVLLILNVPFVHVWVQLIKIPYKILYPLIILVCGFGIYSVNNNINDIYITLAFGVLGYIFILLDLEPAPMMMGLVLGPMLEEYFRRLMMISRGNFTPFIEHPISLGILIIMAIILVFGLIKNTKKFL
jgi:putative tricarboxylic transport membrane protein